MKIVFFSNYAWTLVNFRLEPALALVAQGHEVVFVSAPDGYEKKLPSTIAFVGLNLKHRTVAPFNALASFFRFCRLLKMIAPQRVFLFTLKPIVIGAAACAVMGVRYNVMVAGVGSIFLRSGPLALIAKTTYRFILKCSCGAIFQNKEDLKMMVGDSDIYSVLVPGSGVDLNKFKYVDRRWCGEPKFLFASRLIVEKGFYVIVEALRILREKEIVVVVDVAGPCDLGGLNGVTRGELKLLEDEGLINYLGMSDDIENLYSCYHSVILPSFYREGVPRSLIEAAASGLIIITTDSVGCRETVINGDTGFLVAPKSPESLASTIEKVLGLDELSKEKLSLAARNLAEERFSIDLVIEGYKDMIKR